MSSGDIRVEDLSESNIDDLIYVCSSSRLGDPIHKEGIEIKKKWLRRMLKEYGSVAKIAYYNCRPVAQALYYPANADPAGPSEAERVLFLNCIYNPFPEAQLKGIGTILMRRLLSEAGGAQNPRGRAYSCIVTHAFDTKEFLPLPQFYEKMGFKPVEGGRHGDMYLRLGSQYEGQPSGGLPPDAMALFHAWCLPGNYTPLPEDEGRAIIFYSPVCQFSYPFAVRVAELIRGMAPDLPIDLVNYWDEPERYIARGRTWLVINARAIRASLFDKEAFLKEVRDALSS